MSNLRNACDEYQRLSRRQLMVGAATLGAAATLPNWVPKVALAQSSGQHRDALVVIFLRGGADGLSFCVPHGDPAYYLARPTIAVPQPGSGDASKAIDVDGFFGLPAAFGPLMSAFNNGHLGVVSAVGRKDWSYSHFDAQNWLELGTTNFNNGGWLSRHLATSQPEKADAAFRGFAFSDAMPLSLVKAQQMVVTSHPYDYSFDGQFTNQEELETYISRMYARVQDDTRANVRDAKKAIGTIQSVGLSGYIPSGSRPYSDNDLGHALKCTAAMIKADIGLELSHIDTFGWDTHGSQGTTNGNLRNLMDNLAANLAAFYEDMMTGGRTDFTVVVMSEFGRQVSENGSQGTDHGRGGTMITLGPNVLGGIHCDWPGLHPAPGTDTYFDLEVTTDMRAVLRDLVIRRLKNNNADIVVPNSPFGDKHYFAA